MEVLADVWVCVLSQNPVRCDHKNKYLLYQCMLRRMRTSVLFIGRFSDDSFSNPYVRKCQVVEFLLMLETEGG